LKKNICLGTFSQYAYELDDEMFFTQIAAKIEEDYMICQAKNRQEEIAFLQLKNVVASDSFNNFEDDIDHFKATTYTYDIGLSMQGNVAY